MKMAKYDGWFCFYVLKSQDCKPASPFSGSASACLGYTAVTYREAHKLICDAP